MRVLSEYWSIFGAIGAALAVAYIRIKQYLKLSEKEQEEAIAAHKEAILAAVKSWLLKGVIDAERDLGAGTGRIKIRAVYERAIQIFGSEIITILTLDQFNELAQKPLEEMRKILDGSISAKEYVEGGD